MQQHLKADPRLQQNIPTYDITDVEFDDFQNEKNNHSLSFLSRAIRSARGRRRHPRSPECNFSRSSNLVRGRSLSPWRVIKTVDKNR